jgi:hypothetical protein
MTEQPPSASKEALQLATELREIHNLGGYDDLIIARILDRFAERGFQSARAERPAPPQQTYTEEGIARADAIADDILRGIGVEQPTQEAGQLGCGDHWRPGATASKEHGVEIRIKIAHARGVPAYWDAGLQTFVLSRPVNVESVREPLGWQPLVPSALASTGEQPACGEEPRCEGGVPLGTMGATCPKCGATDNDLCGYVFSAVASERDAAAIRAFGKRVWSDSEEVAYQAGVSDTRARLQEPDEELVLALARVICPQRWSNLNAGEEESEKARARAAITKIAEILK